MNPLWCPQQQQQISASMQQCSTHLSDHSHIPWILQKLLFSHTSFWRESFLNISNHLPDSWPELSPLIFADSCPGCQNYPVLTGLGSKNEQFSQFAHIFHRDQTCLASPTSPTLKLLTQNLYLSDLIMPKLVFLMTVQEAHKEYNSLIDQIQAKYELLDSGECGSVGTHAFNAECSELAYLMAHMSELCRHLNLPMPKELHRPPHFKHWSALNSKFYICGRFS